MESRGSELLRLANDGDGEALAAVALHYGLLDDVSDSKAKVVCPLHEDLNPSMTMDFNTGMWYCFGCGEAGKAQKLVREVEKKYHNANDLRALQVYFEILKGADVEQLKKVEAARSLKTEDFKEFYAQAYDFYHGLASIDWYDPQFLEAEEAKDYMEARGFTSETLTAVKAKVTFEEAYPIVFPILDNGKFKGWVSRTFDIELSKTRKYLYNKGFRRSNTLAGNYEGYDYVIIVEGFMDRLKLLQLGLPNVVAVLGWKLSDRQIEKLKEAGISHVVAATDNDEAGRKGAKWIRANFESTIRWPYLKDLKDPGDFNQKSFDKMFDRLTDRMEKAKWAL